MGKARSSKQCVPVTTSETDAIAATNLSYPSSHGAVVDALIDSHHAFLERRLDSHSDGKLLPSHNITFHDVADSTSGATPFVFSRRG